MPRLIARRGSVLTASLVATILAGSACVAPSFAADPAQLSVTGKPRAVNNAYGGLAVEAGVLGSCPDGMVVCTGTGSITGHGAKKASVLGSDTIYVSPGISQSITITLAKRGQKLLKKLGKLKIAISISLSGPDGQAVTAANGGTVKLPKSLRKHP
jgi:hypothetical protein